MSNQYCFQPLRVDGGGTVEGIALSNGVFIAGGDVEGIFRSEDDGDHWTIVNNGNQAEYLYECACVTWSVTESNTVYAGVGNAGASGGFLASTDGGFTWSVRSTTVQFSGNHAASPLPTGGWPRSIGNLITQDGTYVYAATYNGGVYISAEDGNGHWGTNWTLLGLGGGNYYCRGMAIDTVSKPGYTILYVATYDWDTASPGTYGHVWQYDPSQPSPAFVQLTQSPPLVEELRVVEGYLYAVCGCGGSYTPGDGANPVNSGNPGGVYRVGLSGLSTSTAWTSLNDNNYILPSTSSATPPYWLSIDGYTTGSGAGTTHTIIIGCTNAVQPSGLPGYRSLVQLIITNANSNSSFGVSYSDLSAGINPSHGNPSQSQGQPYTINLLIPPENRLFWAMNTSDYQDWIGGKYFTPSLILIDPNNSQNIYLSGTMGFYRSYDGGANWQIAINGMPLFNSRSLQTDPNNPLNIAFCADDYGVFKVSDGIGYDLNTSQSDPPKGGLEGYCLAYDPVGTSAGSTLYLSLGTKYANSAGDVYHLPAGSTTWVDDGLNLAGNTQPLAVDTFNRNVSDGWGMSATVIAATTAPLPSYTYSNGVLTAVNIGALVIDGYTLQASNVILVKNETGANQAYNGVYKLTQVGNNTNTRYKLTLSTSFNTPAQVPAAMVSVTGGTVNAGATFACSTPGPSSSITLGTTPITWVQQTNNLPVNGLWTIKEGLSSAFSVGGGSYDANSQSITPGTANIQLPSTGSYELYVGTLATLTALDSSGQVDITWSTPASGGIQYADIILCYTTANPNNLPSFYALRLQQSPPPTANTVGTVQITLVAYYIVDNSGTYTQTPVQFGNATLNPGASGLTFLALVQAATTTALPTYTYQNGTSGVGATITATDGSNQLTIDGYEALIGDRLLVQNETGANQAYNGIYVVTDNGDTGNPFVLTRSTDFDTAAQIPNTYTSVENGVVNEFASFSCSTTGSITVGTTAITWAIMQQQYYVPGENMTMQYILQQSAGTGGTVYNTIYFSAWTGGAGNQPASWLLTKTDKTYLGPGGLSGAVGLGAECEVGYSGNALIQFSNFDISTPTTPSEGPDGDITTGLFVGRDANNNRYVLAAVEASGIWRKLAQGNWAQVSATGNTLALAQAATIAALPTNTYNNGTAGVGATLTASTNGALVVDGYTVQTNDRILVTDEATSANNGIYVATNTGSSTAPYVLTRSTDFNQSSQVPDASLYIINGTKNAGLSLICITTAPITIGTTAITWMYAPMCAHQPSPSAWFVSAPNSPHVYLFDRGSGIYCSTNYGIAGSWNLVWSVTAADNTHGYMAMNPNYGSGDEVWVSTNSGLYVLSNAANGTVGNGVTLTQISGVNTPGPITFDTDGNVYCIDLPYTDNTQNPAVFYPTELLRSTNGGSSWEPVGDITLQRVTTPTSLTIGANGRIYIGTGGNVVIVGYNIGQGQTT